MLSQGCWDGQGEKDQRKRQLYLCSWILILGCLSRGMCYTPCLASSSCPPFSCLGVSKHILLGPHNPRGSHSSQIIFIQDDVSEAMVGLSQLAHKKWCTFLPVLSFLTCHTDKLQSFLGKDIQAQGTCCSLPFSAVVSQQLWGLLIFVVLLCIQLRWVFLSGGYPSTSLTVFLPLTFSGHRSGNTPKRFSPK